jgi:hypothetical protein
VLNSLGKSFGELMSSKFKSNYGKNISNCSDSFLLALLKSSIVALLKFFLSLLILFLGKSKEINLSL